VAWPAPGPRPLWVRPPWPTSDATLPPIKTPRWKKPKDPINFLETHRDLPPSSTQDWEGLDALPGTLPERGITTRGLLHCHACLWHDEWVVYLGLWVHSWRGVNLTNVLDEGLRIGEIGHRMNSKVKSVKQGGYESKRGCRTWLAFNLANTVPSWPLYIGGQVSRIG
jgi:hypothetical protein